MTSTTRQRPVLTGVYRRVVGAEADATVAENGLRQVVANTLQSAGDQVVAAKTVLPWLLAGLGAPGPMAALLVPVRESGSMLPQAALAPRVTSRRERRWVWVAGAAGQATATLAMAAAATWTSGAAAGIAVLVALAGFAVSRSLCSLAGKDVLGRTVPKGERGRVTGVATAASGLVALALGLALRLLGSDLGTDVLTALLVGAAAAWVLALLVYAGIREPAADAPRTASEDRRAGWAVTAWQLVRRDAPFRRFVTVRALFMVSALAPPFLVGASAAGGGSPVSGLGTFVVASGLAALLGGRVVGGAADRSSRRLMAAAAGTASVVVLAVAVVLAAGGGTAPDWLLAGAFFVVSLVHVGVRVGRKTYVVDLAEGDRRTEYVAVANTAMGVLLLVVGVVTAGLAALGTTVALAFLGVLGLVGVALARTLPEVSAGG